MYGIDQVACADDHLGLAAPLGGQAEPAADASPPCWRRLFPGEPRHVSEMRKWLRSFLPECAAKDDVLCVACELATNAVQHTRTGPDGWFGVQVIVLDHKVICVTVADGGGPCTPQIVNEPQRENGRGLCIVGALSARYGYSGDEGGRQVWAEVPWHGISEARV